MQRVYDLKRSAYRKTLNKVNSSCVFCDANIIKTQSCSKLEGKYWRVFVNKYPYMDGNLMIVPKRHLESIEDLNKDEKEDFFEVLNYTKKILGKIFKTKSFNVSLNLGENSGGSIRHLHWQIIPRSRKENPNSINIFSDIYIITISPMDLKKKIESFGKK